MSELAEQLEIIKDDFRKCRDILLAIGDETRQSIIITLLDVRCMSGMRVGEITERTHLSRPAVSHHLKILKDAGIINVNRTGTLNYYYLESSNRLMLIKNLITDVETLLEYHCTDKQKGRGERI